jgi:hypothetical protein
MCFFLNDSAVSLKLRTPHYMKVKIIRETALLCKKYKMHAVSLTPHARTHQRTIGAAGYRYQKRPESIFKTRNYRASSFYEAPAGKKFPIVRSLAG